MIWHQSSLRDLAIVVLVSAVAFAPLWLGGFGFVNYDDPEIVFRNPEFLRPGGPGWGWMFAVTPRHMGHYQPLTWMSLALDLRIHGLDDPDGWHRTNLYLHLANAALLSLLARPLLLAAGVPTRFASFGAVTAALAWAVHPLRVESVAWITERRDVLSGLFFLGALLAYLGRVAGGRRSLLSLWPTLLLYSLSLAAKAWGITFFVVLLLLDAYPLGRFTREPTRRLLLEKVPFAVVGAFFAWQAFRAQEIAAAAVSFGEHGLLQRLAQAVFGLCYYPLSSVWPVGQCCLYQLPPAPPGLDPTRLVHIGAAVLVVVITGFALVRRRRWPWFAAIWLSYATVVAPVLGLHQSGAQKVADRYTYLAMVPWAMGFGGAMACWAAAGVRARRWALVVGGSLLLAWGARTWSVIPSWRDSVALWERAVASPWCGDIACFNLGRAYEEAGRVDDAVRLYRLAVTRAPAKPKARLNLGLLLAQKRRDFAGALREFETLVSHHPEHAGAHHCIGLCQLRLGRHRAARAAFERAVAVDPNHADAHDALARLHRAAGRRGLAARHRAAAQRARGR